MGKRSRSSGWIRPDLREAIYVRDRHTCLYCGVNITEGKHPDGEYAMATLDHKTPPSRYRGKYTANHPSNLLTSCRRCNSAKGDMTMPEYVRKIGLPHLDSVIRNRVRTDVYKLRKELNERRSFLEAVDKEIDARIARGELIRVEPDWAYADDPPTNSAKPAPCWMCSDLCPWCDPDEPGVIIPTCNIAERSLL